MQKLSYGDYTGNVEPVFAENKGYHDPGSEEETRKQLSQPLKEVQEFVNNSATVLADGETVVQLGVVNRTVKYRTDPLNTWNDIANAGHKIYNGTVLMNQRSKLRFEGATILDDPESDATVISGVQGERGEQGIQGVQGLQGPKGDSFKIIGSVHDFSNLPSDAQVGDAYAVLGSGPVIFDTPAIYVRNQNSNWDFVCYMQVGPQGPQGPQGIQGAQGPAGVDGQDGQDGSPGVGVPTGGETGYVLVKSSSTDYDCEWTDTLIVDSAFDKTSPRAQSGQAMNGMFPVGSIYVTSTNNAPTHLSGTWSLIDKEYEEWRRDLSSNQDPATFIADAFEPSTNASLITGHIKRGGKTVWVKLRLRLNTNLGDRDEVVLGTFRDMVLGSGILDQVAIGMSDGGNGFAYLYMPGASRELKSLDVVTKESGGYIPSGSVLDIEFVVQSSTANMDDSLCDKFFWKKTGA